MCGISGIINFKKIPNKEFVFKMNNSIKYRGPDHQALWSNNFCSIGVVRLKIIDLSDNSNQPFEDKEAKISIIYNGEIYNYQEIKKNYFSEEQFKSEGDGEIILKLYRKFGINFINKIKGMFSIFICDEKKKKTYLIRDRFGIKQLYYYFDQNKKELTFCSEIKGLFNNPYIKKEVNFSEIYKILNLGLIDSNNQTCFSKIFKVPCGSYIEFNQENFNIKNYYKLEDKIDESLDYHHTSYKTYSTSLKEKMISSFKQHTKFDVAGGIHMSGGSDSALLAAMAYYSKKNLTSYTFDFENKKYSEINEAKDLARSVNLQNKSVILQEKNLVDYINKVIEIQYEPFSSLRILSQNYLYETYKDESRVILDGSGGDEIGAGYRYHILPWYLDMVSEDTNNLNSRFLKTIGTHESLSTNNFVLGSITNYLKPGMSTQDGSMFEKKGFLNSDFLKKFKSEELLIKQPFKSHLRNAQYADFHYSKLPRSLRYTDRASMRSSVEARLPLLDHDVVEQCFQIPSKFKFLFSQDRIILKDLFKKNINQKILFKNKKTIADPQTAWIKKNLLGYINDTLNSANFLSKDIINNNKVKIYIDKISKSEKHINSSFLIRILLVEWWRKTIVNS
jgi:asparagine synthase (glutamine-hydrolysing)